MELLNQCFTWVLRYWEPVVALLTLIVVIRTYRKSRIIWSSRNFLGRMNFSLNYIQDNTLKIRTLREADIDQILLNNPHGKRVVLKYARRHTSLDNPFLELPKGDRWIVLNAILNEISEQFADGFLAASMGHPVKMTTYVFGITCEKDKRVRLNKIRVMLIEKSLLERIDTIEDLQFERPSHVVRLETLRNMKEIYNDDNRQSNLFEVELAR